MESGWRGRWWATLRESSVVRKGRESKRENKSIEQKVKGFCLARRDRRGLGVLQQDWTQPPPTPSFCHQFLTCLMENSCPAPFHSGTMQSLPRSTCHMARNGRSREQRVLFNLCPLCLYWDGNEKCSGRYFMLYRFKQQILLETILRSRRI